MGHWCPYFSYFAVISAVDLGACVFTTFVQWITEIHLLSATPADFLAASMVDPSIFSLTF